MAFVVIQVGESRALCEDYRWTSQDKNLQRRLSELLEPHGASAADPWPEWTQAQLAIKRFGGKIIGTKPPSESEPGVIY